MAVKNFADIYTLGVRVYISENPDTDVIYHSEHTHLIGDRTTDHSPHLFYTLSSDDRLWFPLCGKIALRTLFLRHYVSTHARNF